MKGHVKQGHSVSFGLYNAQYWYVPNTPSEQATYDHIASVYSISSFFPGDEYHPDDTFTFSDHGLYSGGRPGMAGYAARSVKSAASTTIPLWNYTLNSDIVGSRIDCDTQTVNPYCIPYPTVASSGGNWAVAYLGSMDNQTYPVSLTTTVNTEGGMDSTLNSFVCPGSASPDYTCCNGCMPQGSNSR